MAVKNQFQQIQFSGGISPKTDPLQVQQPQVLQATNIEYSSAGAAKRRAGFTALPTTGAVTPTNLQSTLDQLLMNDVNGALYAYSVGTNAWVNNASISPFSLTTKKIESTFQGSAYVGTGIRNLTWAHNGAGTGLLAYDGGYTYGTGNNLGTITLICFDTTTGRPFWGRTTTGAYNTAGTYLNFVNASYTVNFTGNVIGAGYPQIIYNAASGNFIVSFLAASAGTIKNGATVVSSGNLFFPVVTAYLASTAKLHPYTVTTGSGTGNAFVTWLNTNATYVSAGGTSSDPQNYFDIQNNGSGNVALVQFAATYNASGALSGSPQTVVETISPTAASVTKYTATTSITGATAASPISMAMDAYLITQPGAFATGYGTGTFNSTTMSVNPTSSAMVAHTAAFGSFAYPLAIGVYDSLATVTNGYLWEIGSSGGANWVYINSGNVNAYMIPTQAKPAAVTTNTVLTPSPVASQIFYVERVDNAGYDACCWLYSLSSGGTPTVPQPAGGAFGVAYCVRINGSSSQPIATALYMRTQIEVGQNGRPASVNVLNGAFSNLLLTAANIADQLTEIELCNLQPNPNPSIIPLPAGAIFTGANTAYFDGQSIRTAGWPKIPEIDTAPTTATSGGGLMQNTTYTYYFVFADYDINGNVLYSSPSPPYSVTTGGTLATCTITFNLLHMLPSSFNSYLATIYVYRNCSPAVDPLNYYRVATLPMSGITGTWTDTTFDNVIGNILLYSPPSGGELPNDMAPASSCAISTKSRCYIGSAENGSWLYYSKPFYYGRMPCEFNAAQYIDIDPSTGPIAGLGALDENIIIFKQNNIYLLTGAGPDATGVGSFNPPAQLASDTGLTDVESLITTEDGIYFRSARGIEILTRAYAVTYIGEPVEPLLYGTVCLNSIVVPTHNQVRFFLSSGTVLCYDYTIQAWTNYSYADYYGAGSYVADAALFMGQAYILLASNPASFAGYLVATEPTLANASLATTATTDSGTYFSTTLQTAHIPFPGPEGWGRIRRVNILGTVLSATTLYVTFIYDYGASSQTIQVPALTAGVLNVRVRAPRQPCSVVSIQIVDTPITGTGQGCVISKLVLETSIKSGALRTPDSASF